MSQKIVFIGTPEFSVPTLESLVNSNHKVLAVYSQPDSKANRGQKLIPSRVEVFAKENSLKEIFGTGTAAVVSEISEFEHKTEHFILPDVEDSYAKKLKKKLVDIQTNKSEDPHNWRYKV